MRKMLIKLLVLSLTFLSVASCSIIPKFKIGDCISFIYPSNEFEPQQLSVLVHKITKIGNTGYLTVYPSGSTFYIEYIVQDFYQKVQCHENNSN